MTQNSFLEALAAITGANNVLTGESNTAPYTTDWRKQFSGAAVCVARPVSSAQV